MDQRGCRHEAWREKAGLHRPQAPPRKKALAGAPRPGHQGSSEGLPNSTIDRNNKNKKQEAGLPPSQARSPAQQGPGRRHKEHRRPGLSPGGLARRCLSSIICWALRKLFSLNRMSVGKAEPAWVSVLVAVPAVGDFSSHFKDSPMVGWGPCPVPLPRPQLPSPGLRWEQHGGAEPRVSAALGEEEGSSGLVGSFGGIFAKRLPPGDSCVRSNRQALSPALGCHCRGASRSFEETSSN